MARPNADQEAVLIDASRVRVVRATPGSGKTWLIAELIRRELEVWQRPGSGVAALSFTRVGGEEIRGSLGRELDHPHFVGTIDAFLFRYLVRPFYSAVYPNYAPPRLLPADVLPASWKKNPRGEPWTCRGSGGSSAREYNPFDVCYVDSDSQGAVLATRNRYRHTLEPVLAGDRRVVMNHKHKMWKEYGFITHADTAYLASEILQNNQHGDTIRRAVIQRFPLMIVDELQDTGTYLAKCLLALLRESGARAVVAGDPDQAIYEFNGARPDLFAEFEALASAHVLPLPKSLRCPLSIATCASQLKDAPGHIVARDGGKGRAVLIQYDDMVADIGRLSRALEQDRRSNLQILARSRNTVDALNGCKGSDSASLYCPALTHLQSAVREFRQGRKSRALALSVSAVNLAAWGTEAVSEEQIRQDMLNPSEWRRTAVACLLGAHALEMQQTLHAWQLAAAAILDSRIAAVKSSSSKTYTPGQLKPQKREGWDRQAKEVLPDTQDLVERNSVIQVRTIHSAKGETHDTTVVVFPDSAQEKRCLSHVLWSNELADREERRIAYVAVTRPREQLLICVSKRCAERLAAKRPEFMATCVVHTVESYCKEFSENSAKGQPPELGPG